ncbi:MAG: zinc-dependent alcohol dehydrogenase [Nitrososphaerales archaeon]
MQAVIYPKPNEIIVGDVPIQKPAAGEALVKIRTSTICGTDLKILAGKFPGTRFPHIPGHEWSGEVVDIGQNVVDLEVGDRVGNEPHVGCGFCPRCLEGLYNLCFNYGKTELGHAHIGFTTNGGLAEYCTCSIKALHRLPASMSYDEGAFTESVGVALYALERARVDPGDNIAILGPGAIGLVAVQIAKRAKGASKVVLIGTREERLKMGLDLGADYVLSSNSSEDLVRDAVQILGGNGFDVVAEFAGTEEAAKQAIQLTRRGGRVVLAGSTSPGKNLNVDLSLIVRGHLDIFGSLANPKWICEKGVSLVASGFVNVKPLMSGDYKLEQYKEALDAFQRRSGGSYRVMIHP